MKHAIIDKSGLIVNVIELEDGSQWSPQDGFTLIKSEDASIGRSYVKGKVVIPKSTTPKLTAQEKISNLEHSVTARRLRESLLGASGKEWLKNIDDQIQALRSEI